MRPLSAMEYWHDVLERAAFTGTAERVVVVCNLFVENEFTLLSHLELADPAKEWSGWQ